MNRQALSGEQTDAGYRRFAGTGALTFGHDLEPRTNVPRCRSSVNLDTMQQRGMKNSTRKHPVLHTGKMVAFWLLLIGSGYGLSLTVAQPDQHPAIFALSLSWVIAFFASALTGKIFLRMDPKRHQFLPWEDEGRFYEHAGLRAFRWVVLRTPLGWMNPVIRRPGDLDPLLRELSMVEGVHWVGGGVSLAFATGYFQLDIHRSAYGCCYSAC